MSVLELICRHIATVHNEQPIIRDGKGLRILPLHVQHIINKHCEMHEVLDALCDAFYPDEDKHFVDHAPLTEKRWDQELFPETSGFRYCVTALPYHYSFRLLGTRGEIYMIGNAGIGYYIENYFVYHYDFPDEAPFYAGAPRTRPGDTYIIAAMVSERYDDNDVVWFVTSDLIEVWYHIPRNSSERPVQRKFACIRNEESDIMGHQFESTVEPFSGSPLFYRMHDRTSLSYRFSSEALQEDDGRIGVDRIVGFRLSTHFVDFVCSGDQYATCVCREFAPGISDYVVYAGCHTMGEDQLMQFHQVSGFVQAAKLHIVHALDILIMAFCGRLCMAHLGASESLDEDGGYVVIDDNPPTEIIDVQSSPSGQLLCAMGEAYIIHVYKWDKDELTYKAIRYIDVTKGFVVSMGLRRMKLGEHLLMIDDEKLCYYNNTAIMEENYGNGKKQKMDTSKIKPTLEVWNFGPYSNGR